MNFADAIKQEEKWTYTENGERALNTTGDACLNFFSTVGALRSADEARKQTLFEEAYKEDPLLATKILFYTRDIRGTGGLGERQTFRDIVKYCAKYHPEAIKANISLFGEYGRWDDVYSLVGTPLEHDMWAVVREVLTQDLVYIKDGKYKNISLLAKWLKTPDASTEKTAVLGKYTADHLGLEEKKYRQILSALRKALKIVERDMSANRWDKVNYSAVPSRASMIYRNAFQRHDKERYDEFISKAVNGEAKINASTLYPYDIIEKYNIKMGWWNGRVEISCENEDTCEALWRQLPNYVEPGTNAIVIADTSGSMEGRPLDSALGLAIYFAQRNTGAYHNLWMNFSSTPNFQQIKGSTLKQILSNINYKDWESSTNLEAAFDLILDTAVKNHVPNDELPKSLLIISDMEVNCCNYGMDGMTFYEKMKAKFTQYGYDIPTIVFWNVNSRHDTFLTDKSHPGTILVSGQSASTFRNLVGVVGLTPTEFMHKVIDSERYEPIRILS